jgi:hypothetical protein
MMDSYERMSMKSLAFVFCLMVSLGLCEEGVKPIPRVSLAKESTEVKDENLNGWIVCSKDALLHSDSFRGEFDQNPKKYLRAIDNVTGKVPDGYFLFEGFIEGMPKAQVERNLKKDEGIRMVKNTDDKIEYMVISEEVELVVPEPDYEKFKTGGSKEYTVETRNNQFDNSSTSTVREKRTPADIYKEQTQRLLAETAAQKKAEDRHVIYEKPVELVFKDGLVADIKTGKESPVKEFFTKHDWSKDKVQNPNYKPIR